MRGALVRGVDEFAELVAVDDARLAARSNRVHENGFPKSDSARRRDRCARKNAPHREPRDAKNRQPAESPHHLPIASWMAGLRHLHLTTSSHQRAQLSGGCRVRVEAKLARPEVSADALLAKPADELGDDFVAPEGGHQVDALDEMPGLRQQLARLREALGDAVFPGLAHAVAKRLRHYNARNLV